MPTKLSRLCDGFLEALWLVAIIAVPVFFNIYSSRIFEPDKLTLLRSIALSMLFVWIVKISETGFRKGAVKEILKTPLVIPALATAFIYILSTIFSVSLFTSLWGSYQRLQGTYTTLSYLVVFFVMIANLRNWEQIDRLLSTLIIASLPVSLYGVLQRYRIDPIPWGGDVSARIASNMGNAIFVAAYLIMVFPITIGRILESFRAILLDKGLLISNFTRATAYVFIVSLQVIALYFTGSRGPTLGWLTGGFILMLMLALIWRKRNFVIFSITLALLGASFLLILNIKNGPLEALRSTPAIGRFGQLLDEQSNNARVRNYIWIGAVDLVAPHAPLEYPDGRKDFFNSIRPIIGYGPESMYVAYNPFYPPELTQVEKRNASPDRSHNETWDSLVITGLLGLIVYLVVFSAILYYGLKWLNLITNTKQRNLFYALLYGSGFLFALGFIIWRGVQYVGVGLPFGMVIGLVVYFIIISLTGSYPNPTDELSIKKAVLLSVLLAAIVAHFVEINFGIAIAVTRTYFWVYAALLFIIGYVMNEVKYYEEQKKNNEMVPAIVENKKITSQQNNIKRRKKVIRRTNPNRSNSKLYYIYQNMFISAFIMSVLLMILGYEFISVAQGGTNSWEIVWNSLVKLRNVYSGISYGVFAMFFTSWLIGCVILISEDRTILKVSDWLSHLGLLSITTLLLAGSYWLLHAGTLANLIANQPTTLEEVLVQVKSYEFLLSQFYLFLFTLVLLGGFSMVWKRNEKIPTLSWKGTTAGIIGLTVVPVLIVNTNIKVIQGDIAFKLAEPLNKEESWPVAIEIYKHAIDLSPSEDYYYLFLGRAYLEYAKTLENIVEREALISRAETDLKTAQQINPLNTDHTANLARLYSLWSGMVESKEQKLTKAQKSDYYFSRSTTLSPNNARLWDEWGLLFFNSFNDLESAYKKLTRAEELDPYYDWTKALLGEYYIRTAETITDTVQKNQNNLKALEYYRAAKDLAIDQSLKVNYTLAEAQLAINTQQYPVAINALNEVLVIAQGSQDTWRYEQTLAQLYYQTGDIQSAVEHAQRALLVAPEDQKQMIQDLINQLQSIP